MATMEAETPTEKVMEKEKGEKYTSGDEDGIQGQDSVHVAKDGMKMYPQPTSDPLDPLNWTSFKKHSILAIVMALYGRSCLI
jgi:hypothetical protein